MPAIRPHRQSSLRASEAIRHLVSDTRDSDEENAPGYSSSSSSYSQHPDESTSSSDTDLSSGSWMSASDQLDSDSTHSQDSCITRHKPKPFTDGRSRICPLYRFVNVSKEKQVKTIKTIVVDRFKQSVEQLRSTLRHAKHPFTIINSLSSSPEYTKRQMILFPSHNCWKPYSFDDKFGCLPRPNYSPMIIHRASENSSMDSTSPERLSCFEYRKDLRLLHVGGYVKSISWSPPCIQHEHLDDGNFNGPIFLAVATYPSPGTRAGYSDPPTKRHGLIQIWSCSMGLSTPLEDFHPKPHLFLVHEWGLILHICWLPLPVNLAFRHCMTQANQPTKIPSTLLNRTSGHLIVASQDGFVRIVSVPRVNLDSINFRNNRKFPLYEINAADVFRLSPCASGAPESIGWPTQLHIRAEFPDRLFVGYSKGHVALYDLKCVDPLFFDASAGHLRPVRLFHLVNGPVRSLSVHPTNGRQLLVQAWDYTVRCFDIEDTVSCTPETPESRFCHISGLSGSHVLWTSRGDSFISSRESCTAGGFTNECFGQFTARRDCALIHTALRAPKDDVRHLLQLGIQGVTHLDLSEPLNALVCATDQGRVEVILCSLDGRTKCKPRNRYLSQLHVPTLQWSFTEVANPELKVDGSDHKCYLAAPEHVQKCKKTQFPDADCPECQSPRSFCWHKLWDCGVLEFRCDRDVPTPPHMDFIRNPHLSITQATFYPYPHAANWLAVGTAFGIVQFQRLDFLYLTEFDSLLNQQANGTSSECLNTTRFPFSRRMPIKVMKAASSTVNGTAVKKNPAARPRGRPRKLNTQPTGDVSHCNGTSSAGSEAMSVKRSRGRPTKARKVPSPVFTVSSDDDDDNEPMSDNLRPSDNPPVNVPENADSDATEPCTDDGHAAL